MHAIGAAGCTLCLMIKGSDFIELGAGQAEWFFRKNIFTCLQGPHDVRRMRVVTRGDKNRIDLRIRKNDIRIGRGLCKTIFLHRCSSTHSGSVNHRLQIDVLLITQRRQQKSLGKFPQPDKTDIYPVARCLLPAGEIDDNVVLCISLCAGIVLIIDENADKRLTPFEDHFVRIRRILQSKNMRDQWLQIEFILREKLQKSSHVALLCPAHVADRIVTPFFFIFRIVAPRAIRARKAQLDLFFVKRRTRDFYRHRPHDDDRAPVADDLTGEQQRAAVFGAGGYDDAVRANSLSECLNMRRHIVLQRVQSQINGTVLPFSRPARGQIENKISDIDSDHMTSGSLENLRGQLPQQAQPDHRDTLAQGDIRLAHPLHGDGTKGGKRSVLKRHRRWNFCSQIQRDVIHLRMRGIAAAGTGNAIPWLEGAYIFANLHNRTSAGIPQLQRRIEPVLNQLVGFPKSLSLHLADNLTHEIRPRLSLAEHRSLSRGHGSFLRAGADQTISSLHQHPIRQTRRHRRLDDSKSPGTGIL